jgi:hypothetical protein
MVVWNAAKREGWRWAGDESPLLGAFSERYIKRGSWDSRQAMINHIGASYPEYNELFAPLQWSWTRLGFGEWIEKKKGRNPVILRLQTISV